MLCLDGGAARDVRGVAYHIDGRHSSGLPPGIVLHLVPCLGVLTKATSRN